MAASPDDTLPAGASVGAYAIERLLGRGGMGQVYLATDTRLLRQIALKLLPADLAGDPDRRTRFEREARLAAGLKHPHICTIYEVGESDGRPFIAMEYVEGTTLHDRVRVDLFSVKEALDISIQIADALDEAGKQHVVHRDLKSANILLTPRGDVKILDFGVAKRVDDVRAPDATTAGGTEAGMVVGTAAYMSPEQALGQPVDPRSDLFSFGVVLYELLTGRLPFGGKTTMELFNAILHNTPPAIPRFNDEVPDPLVRVVAKLLEKDRKQRYQSAREVATDLQRIQRDGQPTRAAPMALRRRTAQLAWLGAAALLVVSAVGVTVWQRTHSAVDNGPSSIVVLPADCYCPPSFLFLKDAVPAWLTNSITGITGLDTLNPPDSVNIRPGDDAERIAGVYGAGRYVTSKVFADATVLSLTVYLVERGTRRTVWSDKFDGRTDEYQALIQRAAEGLRTNVQLTAGHSAASGSAPVTTARSANKDAELAFRAGEYHWNRYNNLHDVPTADVPEPRDFELARESLTRALALDPQLGDAAAELAYLYVFRREAGAPLDEVRPLVQSWAERARQINDENNGRSPLAWSALSSAEGFNDKPDVRRMLQYALKGAHGAPRIAAAQNELIVVPIRALRSEAVREAHKLNPLFVPATGNLANSLFLGGQSNEALAVLDHSPDDGAPFLLVARIEALADLGRTDEALRLLSRLREQAGKLRESEKLVVEYQVMLQRADPTADALLSRYLQVLQRDPAEACNGVSDILPFLSQHNRVAEGIRVLRACVAIGAAPTYDWLKVDRRLGALRLDSGFAPLLESTHEQFTIALAVFDDFNTRGELPRYLVQPLAELHASLK